MRMGMSVVWRTSHVINPAFLCLRAVLVMLLVSTASCGGGGGGGGGGGDSSGGTGVRVLAGSIDSVPVDVISSAVSAVVVPQASFASVAAYRSLKSGQQILTLTKAFNASQVIDSFNVTYAAGERYSILFYGDHGLLGVHAALIKDEVPQSSSTGFIRVVNGATGASSLTTSISSAQGSAVQYGEAGEYTAVAPGTVTVTTQRSSDGVTASSNQVNVVAGKAYTILVAGEIGYYTKGALFTDN